MLNFDEGLYRGGDRVTLLSTEASGDYPVVVEDLYGAFHRFTKEGVSNLFGDYPLVNGSIRYYFIDLDRFPNSVYFSASYKSEFKSLAMAMEYGKTMSNTHILIISKVGDELSSEIVEIEKETPIETPVVVPNPTLSPTVEGGANSGPGATDSTGAGEAQATEET